MGNLEKAFLESQKYSQVWLEESLKDYRRLINEQHEETKRKFQETLNVLRLPITFDLKDLTPDAENQNLTQMLELFKKVESALKTLPPEIQDTFWNAPLDSKMIDIVLEPNISDAQRAKKLAAFFVGGEVESSWLQLRRNLYPVVHERLPETLTLNMFLYSVFKDLKAEDFLPLFIVVAVLAWAIDVQGNPNKSPKT